VSPSLRLLCAALVGLAALVSGRGAAHGQDVISIRGKYYKELSTRVLQPSVDIAKDMGPNTNIGVHFLVDAITSASVASGVTSDEPFSEYRTELGLRLKQRIKDTVLGVFYRYSDESDYRSHAGGVRIAQELWQKTSIPSLTLAYAFDVNDPRRRTGSAVDSCNPNAHVMDSGGTATGTGGGSNNPGQSGMAVNVPHGCLHVVTISPGWSQVLSPTMTLSLNYEFAYNMGYQANPYRSVPVEGQPAPLRETQPDRRARHAIGLSVRKYIPQSRTTLGLAYRFYADSWELRSHSPEVRIYQELTRDLELRLTYRYYTQSAAFFAPKINPATYMIAQAYPIPCGQPMATSNCSVYWTADPKLTAFDSHYPELRLVVKLRALASSPLRVLSGGYFDVQYGYLVQHNVFGNAHVLQAGLTFPY
jgi:hypothetical protein